MDTEKASFAYPHTQGWDPSMDSHNPCGQGRAGQEGWRVSGGAHLGGHHRAELSEQHMSGESEDDDISEGGEPHHPFEVSHVLGQPQAG